MAALCGCGGNPAASPAAPAPVPVGGRVAPDQAESRYHPTHRAAFGPIYSSGCPTNAACGCGNAKDLAGEFNCQLDRLAEADIPITAYLFDGSAWSRGSSSPENTCRGPDCCTWNLGDQVIGRLSRERVRGFVHFWGGCHEAAQYRRAVDRLGHNLLGFYLDDGSSDEDLQGVDEFMESASPGDWEVVAKAFQNREPATTPEGLARWANVAYVGDLPVGFDGLKESVARLLAVAPHVPAPLAELTGYDYLGDAIPDEEVYYRRLHFGALQPMMAHTPYANADPWRRDYGPGLLSAYRHWAWLHRELVPYFYSLAHRMHEDPSQVVVRPGPTPNSLLIGDAIYAPIVTAHMDTTDVELPPGEWIDYWDETRVLSGRLAAHPVPLGREPIFVRQGAIIPLQVERDCTGHGTAESAGSLTVVVYPDEAAPSTFRYRPDASEPWITFSSSVSNQRLTLTADPELPGQPLIYRVERWPGTPESVAAFGATVTVNQGGDMPSADDEVGANGTDASSWFYDAAAQRLIIKVVP